MLVLTVFKFMENLFDRSCNVFILYYMKYDYNKYTFSVLLLLYNMLIAFLEFLKSKLLILQFL